MKKVVKKTKATKATRVNLNLDSEIDTSNKKRRPDKRKRYGKEEKEKAKR